MARQFKLLRGGVFLGLVTLDSAESDFPWFVGWLEPSPDFAAVAPLFAERDRLLEDDGFTDDSGELHKLVMEPGVHLWSLSDGEMSEVVGINITGRRVNWRE